MNSTPASEVGGYHSATLAPVIRLKLPVGGTTCDSMRVHRDMHLMDERNVLDKIRLTNCYIFKKIVPHKNLCKNIIVNLMKLL